MGSTKCVGDCRETGAGPRGLAQLLFVVWAGYIPAAELETVPMGDLDRLSAIVDAGHPWKDEAMSFAEFLRRALDAYDKLPEGEG